VDEGDPLALPDVPVPRGFRLYNADIIADWRARVGDAKRVRLSLTALEDDVSGLNEVPIRALWRLECRNRKVTDADFDLISRFDSLEELDLTNTRITDRAVLGIHTLQQLRHLDVAGCALTDAAMEHIAALRRLEALDVSYTQMTDESLRSLAFHPSLRALNVRGTKVTGERLAPLVTIASLRQLSLGRKQHKHTRRFRAERPDVEILY
jgi:hypothetical protein